MTEEEARAWVVERFGNAMYRKLERFHALVADEVLHQNLIAPSTFATMWTRHIVDSAQLVGLAGNGDWIDIGSGAGFPGIVVAILRPEHRTDLVEPRARRAAFLEHALAELQLSSACVVRRDVRLIAPPTAGIISARAVAPLLQIFELGIHLSSPDTLWVLPKGRTARMEVALAQSAWHGVFHVEHSITDQHSLIVLASKVTRR